MLSNYIVTTQMVALNCVQASSVPKSAGQQVVPELYLPTHTP